MEDQQFSPGPAAAAEPALKFRDLAPGDRAPGFTAPTPTSQAYRFDVTAGRWLVLAFPVTLAHPGNAEAIAAAMAAADVFDDRRAALFVVTADPQDVPSGRLQQQVPGRRVFLDYEGTVSRLYGVLPESAPMLGGLKARRCWVVIDPSLVIRKVLPFREDGSEVTEMLDFLRRAPDPGRHLGFEMPVPILCLPDVFEPEFCDHLVELYEADGGTESGFMRDQNGQTVAVMDRSFKSRSDYMIEDQALIRSIQARILRRIVPEIERVHFFRVTRMERYIVCCYDAEAGGHFNPHRDNTTMGTAHRRYAVSINLNDDFDGGEVSFPEYGPRGFKAPKGGAVIFSCAMLHAVSTVTRGRRFAFLPFLYDDAAAAIRERNAAKVAGGAAYKA